MLILPFSKPAAEFRGPGVHHNFDDDDSGYDVDATDQKPGKSFGIGGYKGRIIFLGDGSEILTDSDDTEMLDNPEEDKDLDSQVTKLPSSSETTAVTAVDDGPEDVTRKAGKPEQKSGGWGASRLNTPSKPSVVPVSGGSGDSEKDKSDQTKESEGEPKGE